MTRIFLTGASGYIGGDLLHTLQATHPEYEIVALVRDGSKAEEISKAYPNIRLVLGDLDNVSLIEDEARNADIVANLASNKHLKSAEAIARGLQGRDPTQPGYWIQVSGASVLCVPEIQNRTFGEPSSKSYGDIDDSAEITDLISQYSSIRVIDNYILGLARSSSKLKTALVFPPIIYGNGRGPINQRSIQVPELARVTLQNRTGFQVGRGLNTWSNIHITDLSQLSLKLVEKAVANAGGQLWAEDGLYFPENGAISFRDIGLLVAQEAEKLGFIQDGSKLKEVTASEADELMSNGSVFWGTNAKEKAQRALKYLAWTPMARSLEEDIPDTVRAEASKIAKL
ncbi:hypothetical protein Plec18170_000713 [Paecilomyces lecythidis]